MSQKKSSLSRRAFLRRTATLAAVPYIVPASVFGRNGAVPPSERILVGGIGIRGRGQHDLRWMLPEADVQFVAICDAQKASRETVKKIVDERYGNNDCAMYPEIREFLATRTDIDAMLITTGDRWHALASIYAMRAGKDVYSEKPSAMTIAEGQGVVETARRYGRIYQTGTQRLSEGNFTFANELLRLGYLGEVHTVRAHIAPWDAAEMKHEWLPAEPLPPKEELDWDAWLGPCPWRPYNSSYVRGGWRNHYDFHTSCIGEWGAHTFAQCQVAIGAADTSAIEYKYVANDSGDGMVTRFANGIKMVLERDMEGKIWHGSCGVRYEGTEGWVSTADGYAEPEVSNPAWMQDFKKLVGDYMARTQRPMSHMRNWLDCIKSRRQTVSGPVMMHCSMSTVHAANVSMWLKRDLRFDPVKEEFVNDEEANRFRSRAMREPWTI
ncbi:MAG: Gfo/Idh/MocA family oxidoreductase [Sedimentisphaerales bacterium]|nr:Gfo/Idh/MocA family oxidoreductase [Sedimentisphaerales bacterium]HNY78108.1 Gfo/Idh/MocA family oxidoreductase [Sedimentisphaerales bacterium]HOC63174.1 Gfo/Idh/MocA family oxidoreductase [Sedimentisphaerales bacterium]HOH64283.1 Gfo/Idh/MocA family oxidoreductase [Sedimentisphaerales bacterium]HPY51372.1 Gfo/Idh/MocA family oxidoreductase [Sedimentisphaerales bacterium]